MAHAPSPLEAAEDAHTSLGDADAVLPVPTPHSAAAPSPGVLHDVEEEASPGQFDEVWQHRERLSK